jgi:hypothetical protein
MSRRSLSEAEIINAIKRNAGYAVHPQDLDYPRGRPPKQQPEYSADFAVRENYLPPPRRLLKARKKSQSAVRTGKVKNIAMPRSRNSLVSIRGRGRGKARGGASVRFNQSQVYDPYPQTEMAEMSEDEDEENEELVEDAIHQVVARPPHSKKLPHEEHSDDDGEEDEVDDEEEEEQEQEEESQY